MLARRPSAAVRRKHRSPERGLPLLCAGRAARVLLRHTLHTGGMERVETGRQRHQIELWQDIDQRLASILGFSLCRPRRPWRTLEREALPRRPLAKRIPEVRSESQLGRSVPHPTRIWNKALPSPSPSSPSAARSASPTASTAIAALIAKSITSRSAPAFGRRPYFAGSIT